jgi:hypothetical protein
MKLTILHSGDSDGVLIVNADTGEELESVVSYSLENAGPRSGETLTVTVRVPRSTEAKNLSERVPPVS